jgi:hypothetical protein
VNGKGLVNGERGRRKDKKWRGVNGVGERRSERQEFIEMEGEEVEEVQMKNEEEGQKKSGEQGEKSEWRLREKKREEVQES